MVSSPCFSTQDVLRYRCHLSSSGTYFHSDPSISIPCVRKAARTLGVASISRCGSSGVSILPPFTLAHDFIISCGRTKSESVSSPDGRGAQARDRDHCWHSRGAASQDDGGFVRHEGQPSDGRDGCRRRSVGGADHAESRERVPLASAAEQ